VTQGEAPRATALRGVAQVRVARPTDRLEAMVGFWRDAIGLTEIGRFADHAGYDGVMLGLPGSGWHLEFTHHRDGSPPPPPDPESLLVLYFPDAGRRDAVVAGLAALGHHPVAPRNPYWRRHAVQVNDPDGWGVMLVAGEGLAGSGRLAGG